MLESVESDGRSGDEKKGKARLDFRQRLGDRRRRLSPINRLASTARGSFREQLPRFAYLRFAFRSSGSQRIDVILGRLRARGELAEGIGRASREGTLRARGTKKKKKEASPASDGVEETVRRVVIHSA